MLKEKIAAAILILALIFLIAVVRADLSYTQILLNPSFTGNIDNWNVNYNTQGTGSSILYNSTYYSDSTGSLEGMTGTGIHVVLQGYANQTLTTQIKSGWNVTLKLWWSKQSVATTASTNTISAKIATPSSPNTWVTVWSDASIPSAGNPTTWAYTEKDISSFFTEDGIYNFSFYFDLQSGVLPPASARAWIDNTSLLVAPPNITANSSFVGIPSAKTGQSAIFSGNCTCRFGTCKNVNIIVQDNRTGTFTTSSTSSSESIYVNTSSYLIGSVTGTSSNYYFSVTPNILGAYEFRVQCSASNSEPAVTNSISSILIANQSYGWLAVTLTNPIAGTWNNITGNRTFYVNATVQCAGNATSICGQVNGTVRYNSSIADNPDTVISTVTTVTPFSTTANPKNCSALSLGQSCELSWLVKATGAPDSDWAIDVNFSSNESSVPVNDTANTYINITHEICNVFFSLSGTLQNGIEFGNIDPSTNNNPALGNVANLYNITESSSIECDGVNLSIRATSDLTNSNILKIANVTFNASDTLPGYPLSSEWQQVATNVTPGAVTYFYFWLSVPIGFSYGDYNTTIEINETKA